MTNTSANSKKADVPVVFLRRRRLARAAALRYLYQADCNNEWTLDTEREQRFWEQAAQEEDKPSDADFAAAREFATKLVHGVIEKRSVLDKRITECANNWTLSRMGAVDRNILRLAAYEILFNKDEVPPLAALDEAIELAKEFGDKESSRFVNGLLDRLVNEKA
jgi:N utilization substance protein B